MLKGLKKHPSHVSADGDCVQFQQWSMVVQGGYNVRAGRRKERLSALQPGLAPHKSKVLYLR